MKWQDLPPYLLYPPLIPYITWLCVKHRMSFSSITKANPLFPYGGLPFAPKHKMFCHFDNILPWTLIEQKESHESKIEKVRDFAKKHKYPLILKPNTGHRGIDVHLAKDEKELGKLLKGQKWDYILQEYCDWPEEFGVFYMRLPNEKKGKIISMTRKVIPIITGDGVYTFQELVEESVIENKQAILERHSDKLEWVIPKGERFRTLVQAAHSRGCMFYKADEYKTSKLLESVDKICNMDGFHFGRLDVKAKSGDDLKKGKFKIIEINGCTSEFIHVYDNSLSYLEGMRDFRREWRLLFKTAAANRHHSKEDMSLRQFIKHYIAFFSQTKKVIGKPW